MPVAIISVYARKDAPLSTAQQNDGFAEAMGSIVIAFACSVPLALLSGVVLADLWRWFAVPLGAPPVTYLQALGVAILVSYFKIGLKRDDQERNGSLVAYALGNVLKGGITSLLFWGIAAVWAHFILPHA